MQRLRNECAPDRRPDRRFWSVPGAGGQSEPGPGGRGAARLRDVKARRARQRTASIRRRYFTARPIAGRTKAVLVAAIDQHRSRQCVLCGCFAVKPGNRSSKRLARMRRRISVLKDCGLKRGVIDPHGPKYLSSDGATAAGRETAAGLAAPRFRSRDAGSVPLQPVLYDVSNSGCRARMADVVAVRACAIGARWTSRWSGGSWPESRVSWEQTVGARHADCGDADHGRHRPVSAGLSCAASFAVQSSDATAAPSRRSPFES
jgi:hypothetical protein